MASRLIEALPFDENAGLHVFNKTANGKKKAIVPILSRKEEKYFQCVAAVYRSSSKGGDKVWMRLVTKCWKVSVVTIATTCVNVITKKERKANRIEMDKAFKHLTEQKVFPFSVNDAFNQLQCLVFIPTSSNATVSGSHNLLLLNNSIEIIRKGLTVKDYQIFQTTSHEQKVSCNIG